MKQNSSRLFAIALIGTMSGPGVAFTQEPESLIDFAKRDPIGMMDKFKATYKQQFPDEVISNGPRIFQLDTCLYEDEDEGIRSGRSRDYMYIVNLQVAARNDLLLRSQLKRAGYPGEPFRSAVDDLTNAEATIISKREQERKDQDIATIKEQMRPHEKQFLKILNQYRASSKQHLPPFENPPFCGGDFIGFFSVKTRPPDGNVRLIREYFFQLCRLSGIDAYSTKCDMWLSAPPRARFPWGVYRYLARWGDSDEECGKVDFSSNPATAQIINVAIQRKGRACEK